MSRVRRSWLVFGLFCQVSALPAQIAPRLDLGAGTAGLVDRSQNRDRTWFQDALQSYHGDDHVGGDGVLAKAGFTLTLVSHQWANHLATQPNEPYLCFDPNIPIEGDHVLVELVADTPAAARELAAALLANGAEEIEMAGRLCSAWVPHRQIPVMAQMQALRFMRPAYHQRRAGIAVSQGDAAARADLSRMVPPGYTGAGVTVGTLSDSYNRNFLADTNASQDVGNSDLPPGILVLEEAFGFESDEGRAMMQIIADLAPGATQQFHTAFNGQAGFANGIRELAEAGCDIIVDDILYFAEPFYQNGLVSQAVNEVRGKGVAYFSACGNSDTKAYEAPFRPSENFFGLSGGALHDFDPGGNEDVWLEISIPVGVTVTFVTQWDEPFFSVSGSPGSSNDIDVLLTADGDGRFSVLSGSLANNVNGDPLEIFTFTNNGNINLDGTPGSDTTFNLVYERFSGAAPGRIKTLYFDNDPSNGVTINELATDSPTVVGHANAVGAISVAAAAWFETPRFGVQPALLESFSSLGGTPLLFSDDGTRLAEPVLTGQPRITAPDGGNTTFFGQSLNDGDSFPNFFGTSAAAPHAAAVAALLLERAGGPGSLTPDEIDHLLRQTATPVATPLGEAGAGAGLVNAEAAIAAAPLGFSPWARLEFGAAKALTVTPDGDADGDGKCEAEEFLVRSDPNKPDAEVRALSVDPTTMQLRLIRGPEIAPGLGQIERSYDLKSWKSTDELIFDENGFADFPDMDGATTFYRLLIKP